jgi:arylsulfatase A-like enzyme
MAAPGDLMTKPNVIILTIDTLRPDRLGCYGRQPTLTPNIDRLASESILFSQAITGGSWTQAALPVLMTSTYASMYGGCLSPLSPDRPSPVEALAGEGYSTAGFSSSPLLSKTYGYQRGFEYFVDLTPGEKDPFLRGVKGGQRLLRQELTHQISRFFGKQWRPPQLYANAGEVFSQVTSWLKQAPTPFFLWAHFMDPHWPYHLEDQHTSPGEIAQFWQDLGLMHEINWGKKGITSQQKAHFIALYERAVVYTDHHLGRFITCLTQSGLFENTLLILVSDHGEEFFERGRWGHFESNLHDEILLVPLIIRQPAAARSMVIPRQVHLLDIMPTVLELCGCPPPENMEGISMAPLWNGDEAKYDRQIAISERWRDQGDVNHIVAMRTEDHKLIWNDRRPNQPELYDLRIDPAERNDIHEKEPGIIAQFQQPLTQHLDRVKHSRPATPVLEPELDEDIIRRLRDLGYVE